MLCENPPHDQAAMKYNSTFPATVICKLVLIYVGLCGLLSLGRFPSGQRELTANEPALPSMVRIRPYPPQSDQGEIHGGDPSVHCSPGILLLFFHEIV